MNERFVDSSLDLLKEACARHPQLRVKIAIDCVEKGYASHQRVAEFLGLSTECWQRFYENFREGDLERVPQELRNLTPSRDVRFLTGFTDDQLDIMKRALSVPFLMAEELDEKHPLLQELRVLMALGVILAGHHNQFRSYTLKVIW